MARIRTIKPEFWSSPDTAACADPWARLLFVAMWNWADDNGRGTANPKELAGFAFPHDDTIDAPTVRRMLGEIRRVFGVTFYTVRNRPYYAIPSWEIHQKIDKRSSGKHPGPEEGEPCDPTLPQPLDQRKLESSEDPAESTPSPRRMPGAGTGEQGNRGTGVESPSDSLAHPEVSDIATKRTAKRKAGVDYTAEFEQWWALYPRKVDKHPASKAYAVARKSATAESLLQGVRRYAAEVEGRDPEHVKHAKTWLNQRCWENYTGAPLATSGELNEQSAGEFVRGEWRAGRTAQIEKLTGLRYIRPDLPDDVSGREAIAKWAADHVRQWITDNHAAIIDRLIGKEAS